MFYKKFKNMLLEIHIFGKRKIYPSRFSAPNYSTIFKNKFITFQEGKPEIEIYNVPVLEKGKIVDKGKGHSPLSTIKIPAGSEIMNILSNDNVLVVLTKNEDRKMVISYYEEDPNKSLRCIDNISLDRCSVDLYLFPNNSLFESQLAWNRRDLILHYITLKKHKSEQYIITKSKEILRNFSFSLHRLFPLINYKNPTILCSKEQHKMKIFIPNENNQIVPQYELDGFTPEYISYSLFNNNGKLYLGNECCIVECNYDEEKHPHVEELSFYRLKDLKVRKEIPKEEQNKIQSRIDDRDQYEIRNIESIPNNNEIAIILFTEVSFEVLLWDPETKELIKKFTIPEYIEYYEQHALQPIQYEEIDKVERIEFLKQYEDEKVNKLKLTIGADGANKFSFPKIFANDRKNTEKKKKP